MITSEHTRKPKEQNKNIMAADLRQAKDSAASSLTCGAPIGRLGPEQPDA
ncbi:hypothetical protein [Bradyrhizobium sp. B120]